MTLAAKQFCTNIYIQPLSQGLWSSSSSATELKTTLDSITKCSLHWISLIGWNLANKTNASTRIHNLPQKKLNYFKMLCSSMTETEMIHANTQRSLVHSCLIRKNIFLSLNAAWTAFIQTPKTASRVTACGGNLPIKLHTINSNN